MSVVSLPHLETFAQAAELGSFTAAARALGLTQAAVSQRIQALEGILNAPLFHRQGGHVWLTEAGHRLYPYAQRILALHLEALAEITGCQAPVAGELILAASSVPGDHLLPDLLAVFRTQHPTVIVRATVTDSQAVLQEVEHGRAHLGLVGGKIDHAHLEFQRFASDELVLVTPVEHRWRRRRHVTLEQLCQEPLILREAGSGSRWCLEQALATAGKSLRLLRVALELGSNEAIKEAVLRGMGLAILSNLAIQKELRAGQLHALQVTGLDLVRAMFVVWDRRRARPIPVRLFLDQIEAGTAPLP